MADRHLTESSIPANVPGYSANVAALAAHAAGTGLHALAVGTIYVNAGDPAWVANRGFGATITDGGVGLYTITYDDPSIDAVVLATADYSDAPGAAAVIAYVVAVAAVGPTELDITIQVLDATMIACDGRVHVALFGA